MAPTDTSCDRFWRWWKRKRTAIFLCLFSVYIILRIGLWAIDLSKSKEENMFFLETKAKKLAIVIPFSISDLPRLLRAIRYEWRLSSLHCLPLPDTSWENHQCGVLEVEKNGVRSEWKADETHMKQRACESTKGYAYFIDFIFYLDGNYDEDLPNAKIQIEDAIGENGMLHDCFETLIFLSSRSEAIEVANINAFRSSHNEIYSSSPQTYLYLKLIYLFKLSELAYYAYDFFFWMPLDVFPLRNYWLDGIYEQVFFLF
jgi:hypothetical protein